MLNFAFIWQKRGRAHPLENQKSEYLLNFVTKIAPKETFYEEFLSFNIHKLQ